MIIPFIGNKRIEAKNAVNERKALETQRATIFAKCELAYNKLKGMNSRRGYADYEDQQDLWENLTNQLAKIDSELESL